MEKYKNKNTTKVG